MAELTVLGWFVSPVIEAMINTARSYIASHSFWRADVEEELHGLETTLTQILTVVSAAERHLLVEDSTQRMLLRQMKDAAFEAEDLLDEFEYLLLKSKGGGGGKVSFCLSPSSLGGAFRAKLKALLSKLDRVNSCAERFLHVAKLAHCTAVERVEADTRRTTCSFLLESEVFGRDAERDKHIDLLMESGDQADFVVTVVGDGGVGKTTLAQLIYNDTRLIDHFELRMWICVPDNFSDVKLTREILALVSADESTDFTFFSLNKLQEELEKRLIAKKFLLVLDDVWFDEKMTEWENKDRWRKLLAPILCGKKGSKILVTTRMNLVARMLDATNSIPLKGLGDEECWFLCKKYAFGTENPDDYPELEKIGRQIARRLKGSPLGAKVVGGMLNTDLNSQKWKNVLENEMYDGIMPVLRLSYRKLPQHLQRCFAYCSIFPKDWKFSPDMLACMWMAQGFIQPEYGDGTRMEDLGRIYFENLLSRSFFQAGRQGEQAVYLMHDLMNDLAQTVSREECFRLEGDISRKIPPTIRHLSIDIDDLPQLANICDLSKLRTLVFLGDDHFVPDGVFKELSSIRVLDLTGCDMEHLPEAVGSMIHLRYLALPDGLRALSASVCRLYHLQVINASKWCWFGRFPEDMSKLISLRHLNVLEEYVSKIAGIGKLSHLQRLSEFHVSWKNGRRIGELKDLNELQGSLHIRNLEKVTNKEEASMAHLNEKKYIKALRLEWGTTVKTTSSNLEILEGLQPHKNLEELDIVSCVDRKAPQWLGTSWMSNLNALYLAKCSGWESLPPLGQLPCLQVLKVRDMRYVTRIGVEFYGTGVVKGFPALEYMRFENMPEWVEWSGVEDCQLCPSLSTLEIRSCPKLKGLPTFLPCLKNISIRQAGPIRNADLYPLAQPSPSSFALNISSSSVLGQEFLHGHHFRNVQELNMTGNSRMPNLPLEEFQAFSSLKVLRIRHYSELMLSMIPQEDFNFMPSSLEHLRIDTCELGDEALSRCLWNLTSLSTLDIRSCRHIVSLPSTRVTCHLTALQQLYILNCEELTSISGLKDVTSLKILKMIRCPKLSASLTSGEVDNCSGHLPSSLVRLTIKARGLVNASLSKFLQNLTCLTTLMIKSCHQITSLPSKEVLCDLTSLKRLEIRKCSLLSSLGGLEAIPFLETLTLSGCRKLSKSMNQGKEDEGCVMPSSLNTLDIKSCGISCRKLSKSMNQGKEDEGCVMPSSLNTLDIKSCGITDSSLSRCLKSLTSLSTLRIECCNNITSIPPARVLCHLTALKDLDIQNCGKFASMDGLLGLVSLTHLSIEGCPRLKSGKLPADLGSLSSLTSLNIMDGSERQSFPDNCFPASLEYISLTRCHSILKEQLTKMQGPEWEKVAHVSQIFY